MSMQLSNASYEKGINDSTHFELQNANDFHVWFKILLSPPAIPLRAGGGVGVSHLLMICLLKPGTQSLVVNFPAHWLLVVTMDTPLSGWDGTGKSIALCWLITDFPTEQNAQIDACSCGFGLSTLPAPILDALSPLQKQFLYRVHASFCPEWVQGTLQWARRLGHTPDLAFKYWSPFSLHRPPLLSTRWCCQPMFVTLHWAWGKMAEKKIDR